MPPYITISEAARLLGVCPKTLRRWDRAGLFKPAFRTAGQYRRYDLIHIKAFTNANRALNAAQFSPLTPNSPAAARHCLRARLL
ncbi:MAG: MerR family transcriptional regulator [Candidatus Helarchaeota archaeon]